MFLDTLSFSFFVPRKHDLINFAKNEPRYPRGTLNTSFVLTLSDIRSRKVARFIYSPPCFPTSESGDASN